MTYLNDIRLNVNAKETARLLRRALVEKWPGCKFRVTILDPEVWLLIRWSDGPSIETVGPLVRQFTGDGTIGRNRVHFAIEGFNLSRRGK